MFRCMDVNYFVKIKAYILMNTRKKQSINSFIFHNGGSCCIETSQLTCSTNRCTGFCMMGTAVMKDSSTYNENLFLHAVKHNLVFLFVCLFFISCSSFTNIHDSQGSRWKGRIFFYIISTISTWFIDIWTLAWLLFQRAASHLKFCSLALSVWLVSWYVYSIGKSLFMGLLTVALAHYSHYRSFFSQNLY